MPQYVMPINTVEARKSFGELDSFTQGYVECALWVGLPEEDSEDVAFDNLAPETLASMVADCVDFQTCNSADLAEWGDDHQAGVDFFLTRNGHGAGFWDRGRGDLGDRLTEMARPYGEVNLYIGDDGKIHV